MAAYDPAACDGARVTGPKKPDLAVRAVSGAVMIIVALIAFGLGGIVLTLFVAAITLGVMWEMWGLVRRITPSPVRRTLAMAGLGAYAVAAGGGLLIAFPGQRALIVVCVIATDIGAYFAGRTFGGPKIAPAISPSKTWSGLVGGMLASALVPMLAFLLMIYGLSGLDNDIQSASDVNWQVEPFLVMAAAGAVIAIVAQAGDFFESWLKRRAGVKDSGTLIPGHGGLFDRVDGLLAASCAVSLFTLWARF